MKESFFLGMFRIVAMITIVTFSFVTIIGSGPDDPDDPPTITSFIATPASINEGDSSTLSWAVTGATSVEIDQSIGSVNSTSGSVEVSPISDTTYTLTAKNDDGSVSATITVTMISNSLIGSWLFNAGSLADSGVLSIIDDTNYFFVVDGEPDDGGGRGMERGTYTWDSSSGAFTATAISSTCDDWGISGLNATVSINGNTLNINDSEEGSFTFTKVSSDTNSIIGGWIHNPGSLADSGVIIFIDNTNYFFAVDGEPDDSGGRGMERGTYTWDSSSGAFTVTEISNTCDHWGISDLNTMTVSIDENTLNLDDSVQGLISLTKIQ